MKLDYMRDHIQKCRKEGECLINLAEFFVLLYPHWTTARADAVVESYSSAIATFPSIIELEAFIEEFGDDGLISLQALAKGVGEFDSNSLLPVFQEHDVDGDGFLSVVEFMSFMFL